MKTNTLSFHEFTRTPKEDWEQEVSKNTTLNSKETLENIFLKPLYFESDTAHLDYLQQSPAGIDCLRGAGKESYILGEWEITQKINLPSIKESNKLLLHSLRNGQNTAAFTCSEAMRQGKDVDEATEAEVASGATISTLEDVAHLFQHVALEAVPLFLNTGCTSVPLLSFLKAYCADHNFDMRQLTGTLGMDPLGTLSEYGRVPLSTRDLYDHLAYATRLAHSNVPELKTIIVSSIPYHNSGANAVQELAYMLATGVQYIDECIKRGLSLHQVLPHMTFSFSVSSHLFMEISKLRAFRMLWANVVRAFDDTAVSVPFIHTETSRLTQSKEDMYTNALRSTVQAFASIVGGADSLHIEPYDSVTSPSSQFAHRLARNTHLILQHETHISKVMDPAGGSWYVEAYTHELMTKAWELFGNIEDLGGMEEALKQGRIQDEVEQMRVKRQEDIECRIERLIGVTHYAPKQQEASQEIKNTPFKKEEIKMDKYSDQNASEFSSNLSLEDYTKLASKGVTAGWMLKQMAKQTQPDSVVPLTKWRAAEKFEKIRVYTKGMSIGIMELTDPSSRKKAEIARSLFESAGFACETIKNIDSYVEIADWMNEQKHEAYVICGSDELVEKLLTKVMTYFEEDSVYVYVVGEEHVSRKTQWQQKGIMSVIHPKTNVIQCVKKLLCALEVEVHV
ncbi:MULTISPECIES: methylmalonyl-CoA mutase family protein [Priestia]|uniref:methylmalonyl-CoA mutase family protein n=1 Tax=Priestia TaxID=2800373 RepID=UPI001C8EF050|nr:MULTISPECIES: methylmalonyl-CoA mutase family protein [Priestia]MBX9984928.1 acyl-CoA mutase large subunit family protein [Priestia aryabhattai]MBY0000710.1 acyl-CoA mutase large subunit family protein [Priestia aryabhattai]UYV52311.1 acyl-CoA mutase large subunit family protein [Priestia megaterium]